MTSPQPHQYPNPGFLGLPSHSAIFNQVSSCEMPGNCNIVDDEMAQEPVSSACRTMLKGQSVTDRAIQALSQIFQMDVGGLYNLVQAWLDMGVNLPLAEPFVARCATATHALWNMVPSGQDLDTWTIQQAKSLLKNTRTKINLHRDLSAAEYFAQMLGDNLRWETLGIFFTAASRAAMEIACFPPLYTQNEQRRDLLNAVTYLGDCCSEICLSLDCLNDLQLVLQFENFIVHSQVDGDQSESPHMEDSFRCSNILRSC